MNTVQHSFINIFESEFKVDQETIKLQKIIIPIIQRDYAQGRITPEIERIRKRFLDTLYSAVECKPIILDFIYGNIDQDGIMTPLDGQQRLTTLFLLHWYAAKKENVSYDEYKFLFRFGYETRYSARYFCQDLISFNPSFSGLLSEEIIDQTWFPLEWRKDPTIGSMLVMLDAIDEKFKSVHSLWKKLSDGAILFYFLPIKDMGLTDELYIKMNSRGKPLTRFEHFKAEFERCVRCINDELSKRIMQKIDRDWTDMLWQYRDSGAGSPDDSIIDDEFLRYFHFICDIICFKNGDSPQTKSEDEFDMLTEYFGREAEKAYDNFILLETYFDCWCHIDGFSSPSEFLNLFMGYSHDPKRIIVENRYKIDIFDDCLHSYGNKTGRTRQFPLNRVVLLYAIICYLQNRGTVTDSEFIKRLRIINNLIQNSADEISDRSDRNRIPAILQQVDSIMLTGNIIGDSNSIDNNFNVNQIQEEVLKKSFLETHPELSTQVYALEDHSYLYGQIGIIGLDHISYGRRFDSLFLCNRNLIDRALMSIGDYGQQERNGWRYQYASSKRKDAWDNLFHKSANYGFEATSHILIELLSRFESFSDERLKQIIDEYIAHCETTSTYPWRYYYVKYDTFRPGSYGKFYNNDAKSMPYMFTVMQTEIQMSSNSYMPYLKEVDNVHLSKDTMGQRLIYGDRYIACENDSFVLRMVENDEEIERFYVAQNEDGIDTEDRIKRLRTIVSERFLM